MNNDRQRAILEILIGQKNVTVKELAQKLYISEPSIRRDLIQLENQRLIKRTHGGAMLEENDISQIRIPFAIRELECSDEKIAIAKSAATLVKDGNVIFLDATSSAYNIVPFLTSKKNITVITSGIRSMTKLAEYGIRVISTGGEVINTNLSLVGNGTLTAIRNYYADICFFSCRGISDDGELSDITMEENLVRQEMIARARQAYYLCTSSKVGQQFYHRLGHVSQVSGIISGSPLPSSLETFRLA